MIVKMLLFGLLVSTIVMVGVWMWQLKTKNAGIVDAWWSFNFTFLVLLYFIQTSNYSTRALALILMVIFWSMRLGIHLLYRNSRHNNKEDIRYAMLRKEYGENVNIRMLLFFLIQAVSNVLLSIPFLLVFMDQSTSLSIVGISGIIIWSVGFFGESLADKQLRTFKHLKENEGRVCQKGLWKYSRHPNYFFEWLIWVGYAVYALPSQFGWLALTAPVIIYYLLNHVTGIPLLEKLAVSSKGDVYVQYQKTTSAFFPWFRKKQK